MKVKVLESFIDKHTDVVYKVGETIEMGDERVKKEILSHPKKKFIEIVKEKKAGLK